MRDYNHLMFIYSMTGSFNELRELLKDRKDINIGNKLLFNGREYTSLMIAAENGHAEIVELLLSKYPRPNILTRFLGTSYRDDHCLVALGKATRGGHIGVVNLLLKENLDLNKANRFGETFLIAASKGGFTEIVKSLLVKGADLNIEDPEGNTALIYAAENGHTEIVKEILNKKLNKSILYKIVDWLIKRIFIFKDNDENNKEDINTEEYNIAFKKAVKNGHREIVETFLDKNVDINIQKLLGDKALLFALKIGSKKLIDKLLAQKINIDVKHNLTHSALMLAAEKGFENLIDLLIETKINVNIRKFTDNSTAILLAVKNDHTKIVIKLINAGADVNVTKTPEDDDNHDEVNSEISMTPLMLAAKNGNLKIVSHLIRAGADINAKDSEGKVAIEYAKCDSIIQLLKKVTEHIESQKINPPSLLQMATQYIANDLAGNEEFIDAYREVCSELSKGEREIIEDGIPNPSSQKIIPCNPTKSTVKLWTDAIKQSRLAQSTGGLSRSG